MKIWVDADAAPNDVKSIVAKASLRLEVETAFVANRRLWTPANNPHVSSVVVPGGPDAADDHIAEHVDAGDLVITADIPLAARAVEAGARVIDPRGEEYTRENVGERLSVRDFMDGLRMTGVDTGGPSARSAQDTQAFAATFDRVLTKAVRDGARGR